jgi:hypothetical protein
MPILNEGNFPFINSTLELSKQVEYRPSTFYWTLRPWGTYDYWYCEILIGKWFEDNDIELLTGSDVLNKIKTDDNTFLVICNSHEAFHSVVEPIYKGLIIKKQIPPHKIILLSESATVHQEVERVSKNYNCRPIQVEWTLVFEKNVRIDLENKEIIPKRIDPNKHYLKKFLNLNRRWRLHRPTFVAFLYIYKLLDYGYVSLGCSDDGRNWQNMFQWMLSEHISDSEFYNLLIAHRQSIQQITDLYLDTEDLKTNRARLSCSLDDFYQSSYFSIVSETNFYTGPNKESGVFLSEKTFKPIAHFHPFMVISVPGTLEKLKELGYKTFHPFIDESYDLESNDFERLRKILKEVSRLSKMPPEDVSNFIKHTAYITEHNFNILKNKTNHIYKTL